MKDDPAVAMLLEMAEKDFTTLRKMADDPEFADEIFGFHAQQSVEKAAKAMLTCCRITFERIHDLEPLFDSLVENGHLGAEDFKGLIDLTDFAVQYRYQAFDDFSAELDRRDIVAEVRKFIDHAKSVCLRQQ